MKILFVTSAEEDYVPDGLLHGFRRLYGLGTVDYPRKDILYQNCNRQSWAQIRGRGFTLYGLLPEEDVNRSHLTQRLAAGAFDLVVFSSIWRQYGLFLQWRGLLSGANTVLVDGEDTPQVYPHAGRWWRRPSCWLLPRATRGVLYFKREWSEDSQFNLWHRLLPRRARRRLPFYRGLRRISLSIPEEKIVRELPPKTKLFGRHIVDPEVSAHVPESRTSHAFFNEAEYRADLQASKFGITTKRAGWDCLRHYEIAANGCVPCFRNLDQKPGTGAPHGLISGVNCLGYRSAEQLLDQVRALSDDNYRQVAKSALDWAKGNSTTQCARKLIDEWQLWRQEQCIYTERH